MPCDCTTRCQLAPPGSRNTWCSGPTSTQWEYNRRRSNPEVPLIWAGVDTGDMVRTPGGRLWLVKERRGAWFHLVGDGGATHQGWPDPNASVLVIPRREMMGDPGMDVAIALVSHVLGGQEVT